MYSFVNIIAIEVNKAVEPDIIFPAHGLIIDRKELVIVQADTSKIFVIINNTLFFSNSYPCFFVIISIVRDFNIFS